MYRKCKIAESEVLIAMKLNISSGGRDTCILVCGYSTKFLKENADSFCRVEDGSSSLSLSQINIMLNGRIWSQ
jgi:hypothetical protein